MRAGAAFRLHAAMPAFVATYSAEQRQALFRAVLGDGLNIKQALRAAAAGELPDLDAESQRQLGGMAYAYACQLVARERDERDGVQLARSMPDTVARDTATALLRRAQQDALKIARDRQKSTMDADAAAKVLRVSRDALALLDQLDARKQKGKTGLVSSAEPKAPQTLASRIAAQTRTAASDIPTPSNAGPGTARDAQQSDADSETDAANGGPVRANGDETGRSNGDETVLSHASGRAGA